MVFRAFKICNPIHLENQLKHITKILIQNNYPLNFITKFNNDSTTNTHNQNPYENPPNNNLNQNNLVNSQTIIPENMQTSTTNQPENNEKEEHWVPLPYIGNISNKVGGFLRRRLKWNVTFTPGIKFQNMLNGIKDKETKEPAGVYDVPCISCDESYIGESKKIAKRLEDHKGNVHRYEYKKSAIARHTIRNKGHKIDWPNAKLIMRENDS